MELAKTIIQFDICFTYLSKKRNAERFAGASFSSHVKNLFLKLTGVDVNINALRPGRMETVRVDNLL